MTDERGEGWTVNSLRTFVTSIIEAHDERYEQRFNDLRTHFCSMLEAHREVAEAAMAAAEKAVTKAETASEKRFESVNEFRASLADQQRTLMPRAETEIKLAAIEEKLNDVTVRLDKSEAGFRYIMAAIGLLATAGSAIYAILASGKQ